jgi:hypothetical protein
MKTFRYASMVAIALAVASMIQTPQVQAGQASSIATAVGSCQGNLPASDANLRKRPLAIRNEGLSNAFISCSTQSGYRPVAVYAAILAVTNLNTVAVELSCTLVDGPLPVLASYYPRTVSVEPNIASVIVWLPSDYGIPSFTGSENFSCNLPPGVEINIVGFGYESDTSAP